MCQWCIQHGEGKKWYLNTKHYITKELFDAHEEIRTAADAYFGETERKWGINLKRTLPFLMALSDHLPDVAAQVRARREKIVQGQIVPLEEAKLIINNANVAALFPCACRQSQLGFTKSRYCLGLTYFMEYGKEWPDHIKDSINYVSIEEAKESVEKAVQKGFVLGVYGHPVPYVAGICMCEYPVCMSLKVRLDYGIDDTVRKAEYVVKHDTNKCVGCGKCVSRCQFKAINLSRTLGKAMINLKKCFGCGVCVQACEREAISLVPREIVPAMKDVW